MTVVLSFLLYTSEVTIRCVCYRNLSCAYWHVYICIKHTFDFYFTQNGIALFMIFSHGHFPWPLGNSLMFLWLLWFFWGQMRFWGESRRLGSLLTVFLLFLTSSPLIWDWWEKQIIKREGAWEAGTGVGILVLILLVLRLHLLIRFGQ